MGLKNKLSEVQEALKKMNNDLSDKSDEKLIAGYKNAMKDYNECGDENIRRAANVIRIELERREIDVDNL